jgi:hypothetical protein
VLVSGLASLVSPLLACLDVICSSADAAREVPARQFRSETVSPQMQKLIAAPLIQRRMSFQR